MSMFVYATHFDDLNVYSNQIWIWIFIIDLKLKFSFYLSIYLLYFYIYYGDFHNIYAWGQRILYYELTVSIFKNKIHKWLIVQSRCPYWPFWSKFVVFNLIISPQLKARNFEWKYVMFGPLIR